MLEHLKSRSRALKAQILLVAFAFRDPRTPWYARAVALLTIAYALSPIDLIPDFVPVLGYLDDLIIVPAGIALAIRLIPTAVMEDARQAATDSAGRYTSMAPAAGGRLGWLGAGLIALLWLVLLLWLLRWLLLLARAHGLLSP